MKQRLLFLLKFYLLLVLVFIVAKVVFMLSYFGEQPFSVGDVCNVIRHGLSLDLSTALYFLIVPFLLTIVSFWTKMPKWLFRAYYVLVAVAFSLAFVSDTSLYGFWHFKLDASCLQYLETPTEAMASVSSGYLLIRLLIVIGVGAAICGLAWKTDSLEHPTISTLSHKLRNTLLFILLIPLIVIGIRGGLDESTTNIGQVYYSDNQFLNHSAVNPVFSFLASLDKSGDYITAYDFYDEEKCQQLTDSLFSPQSTDSDTLLNTSRPNIVIILMESCGGQFTKIGGHNDITPNLNRLMDEGISFKECYANSWRTDKGTVSVLSGYPAFPITSVMKVPERSRKLPSIAASLVLEGYENSFFYGGDINFTNMRSYVMSSGYSRLRWKADYSISEQRSAQWGVRDDLMFASLLDDIRQEKSEHWMKTLLTLSSHEPWDVPTHELDDKVYNAFHYLDGCVGQFVDSLRQMPQWKNLLVVILPDHGYRYQGIDETTRLYNHIPLIWTGGAIKEHRAIDRLCNQSDLAATLLGQMGIDHKAFTFSRDVMSNDSLIPMAWHTYNNGVTVYDTAGFVAYDLDVEKVIAREGQNEQELLERAKALLQLTSHDLVRK